jgi:hypothetical protein
VHQTGQYSSFYITVYLWNTFYLPEGKTFEQLYAEVRGALSKFYNGEFAHLEKNFDREPDLASNKNNFLYQYEENYFVNLPHSYLKYAAPRNLTIDVKPTQQKVGKIKEVVPKAQQSFNFLEDLLDDIDEPGNIILETQTIEEEPQAEAEQEEDLSPLMQDIKNADTLKSKEIYYWPTSLEEFNKLLKLNESITIKKIEDNTFIFKREMEA